MLDLVFTLIPVSIPAVASVVNAIDGLAGGGPRDWSPESASEVRPELNQN
jgi:hypothetical protein